MTLGPESAGPIGPLEPLGGVVQLGCGDEQGLRRGEISGSIDDGDAVFLFENECSQESGGAPAFWTCGAVGDWTILDIPTPTPPTASATDAFAVPPGDGNWTLGISALPQVKLSGADPTLTDAQGNLLVFSNVATPIATLSRSQGTNSTTLNATRTAAFAAILTLSADTPGGPTPQQLLEIRIASGLTTATVWEPFGLCDSTVQGTQSWSGLYPIDVRLTDPGSAKVIFAVSPGGLAVQSALCTAIRANDGTPEINCSAAGPLS